MTYSIVGVTGHIDHGKTTLVKALTGKDTDTHPEEKQRGITIDIGFASFDCNGHTFALIDAPGHQKYIGNLLAGVARIDIGLLLVAADQGIQAQTLEHAAIIRSLGVNEIVVVISRCDLATEESTLELEEELILFLGEIGYQDFPIVRVSSVTQVGLDSLSEQLQLAADRAHDDSQTSKSDLPFRLPVDRVFNVPGRGWVAAGTVWAGNIAIGDSLEIAGRGESVRVREIENHSHSIESSQPGQRTALNLVGTTSPIRRGDELVAPGEYHPSRRFVAELTMFPDAADLRLPADAQLHTATRCVTAKVIGPRKVSKSEHSIVVLELEDDVVATATQPYLLRRPYPIGSFAGGRILGDVGATKFKKRELLEFGQKMSHCKHDPKSQLLAWISLYGEIKNDAKWISNHLQVPKSACQPLFDSLESEDSVTQVNDYLVSAKLLASAENFAHAVVRESARASSLEASGKKGSLWMVEDSIVQRSSHICSPFTMREALNRLVANKVLVRFKSMVAEASEETQLSKKQRAMLLDLVRQFDSTRCPPTSKELAAQLSVPIGNLNALTRFAIYQGSMIDLGKGFLYSHSQFIALCKELDLLFTETADVTVAEIRDRWQLTRKHVIPLLEYCDREKITIRRDATRTRGENLAQILSSLETAENDQS